MGEDGGANDTNAEMTNLEEYSRKQSEMIATLTSALEAERKRNLSLTESLIQDTSPPDPIPGNIDSDSHSLSIISSSESLKVHPPSPFPSKIQDISPSPSITTYCSSTNDQLRNPSVKTISTLRLRNNPSKNAFQKPQPSNNKNRHVPFPPTWPSLKKASYEKVKPNSLPKHLPLQNKRHVPERVVFQIPPEEQKPLKIPWQIKERAKRMTTAYNVEEPNDQEESSEKAHTKEDHKTSRRRSKNRGKVKREHGSVEPSFILVKNVKPEGGAKRVTIREPKEESNPKSILSSVLHEAQVRDEGTLIDVIVSLCQAHRGKLGKSPRRSGSEFKFNGRGLSQEAKDSSNEILSLFRKPKHCHKKGEEEEKVKKLDNNNTSSMLDELSSALDKILAEKEQSLDKKKAEYAERTHKFLRSPSKASPQPLPKIRTIAPLLPRKCNTSRSFPAPKSENPSPLEESLKELGVFKRYEALGLHPGVPPQPLAEISKMLKLESEKLEVRKRALSLEVDMNCRRKHLERKDVQTKLEKVPQWFESIGNGEEDEELASLNVHDLHPDQLARYSLRVNPIGHVPGLPGIGETSCAPPPRIRGPLSVDFGSVQEKFQSFFYSTKTSGSILKESSISTSNTNTNCPKNLIKISTIPFGKP